jgi:sugar phosphate permease
MIGWRGSFVTIGVITLLVAAAIWFLVRNTPKDMGLPMINQPNSDKTGQAAKIGLAQGMKLVLSSGPFWLLAIWFFFSLSIFFSFGGLWGGPYLMQIYGLNKAQAGNILGMLALAMIVGSPFLGWLSDKVLCSRKKVIVMASLITLGLTIPLAFFTDAMNRPILYVLFFLLGIFNSAIVVVVFTAAKELFPVEIAGTSVGLVNLFPFLGGAVTPPILGAILEAQGKTAAGYSAEAYSKIFLIYVLFALIALGAACFITETMKKAAD